MHSALAGLRPKHRRFAEEYVIDLNGSRAAIRAGYATKSARIQASELLAKPNIAAAVKELLDRKMGTVGLTGERVLKEIERLCFFDPRKLFAADGTPVLLTELSDDAAAAIAGLEVLEEYEGQGVDRKLIGYTKKYRLHSKVEALGMAAKYLKLFPTLGLKKDGTLTLEQLVLGARGGE